MSRAAAAKGVSVSAVVTQAEFLLRMGIVQRVQQLLDLPATTDEEVRISCYITPTSQLHITHACILPVGIGAGGFYEMSCGGGPDGPQVQGALPRGQSHGLPGLP